MSNQNGKKKAEIIHTDVLRPSSMDEILLAEAVESRFLTLCNAYFNIRGVCLVPPDDLNADMYRWRQMRIRHRKGDLRNTVDELKSTQRVAQWTVDVNNVLRNQPSSVVEWSN